MKVIIIGSVVHAAINALMGALTGAEVVEWDSVEEAYREKVAGTVQFVIDNPELTAEQQHEQWREARVAEGWVHGEAHDAELKTSPLLVPYAELPAEQRAKDALVHSLVAALKDIPDAEDAVIEALAKLPRQSAGGAAAQSLAVVGSGANLLGVEYIGRRESWSDHIYGTGLTFTTGQQRALPQDVARKLLRHVDLFQPCEVQYAEPVQDDTAHQLAEGAKANAARQEQQAEFAVLDQMNTITTKAGLAEFAKTHFGLDLDKTQKMDVMREAVTQHVKRFGAQ